MNLFYPEPFTVLEIAEIVRDVVRDVSGTLGFLRLGRLISPRESIEYIVSRRLGKETG